VLLDPQPEVAPRDPPIRVRKTVADCWISLELVEGKYHQVRKMTASIGHPTLRLIRVRIGQLRLAEVAGVGCGTWVELDARGRSAVQSHERRDDHARHTR
jgi:23S rRNA pseudouridine2457 synthase